jgi:hypothetical protein
MVQVKSGSGYTSNKLVQSKGYETEPKSKAIDPASVSTLGVSTQFKKPDLVSGAGYQPKPMPETGSRGTYNSAAQGPGSLRTTYRSGSQQATPAPTDMPSGRDTMSEYGPESPTSRGRGR